jgi:hypothetical protein
LLCDDGIFKGVVGYSRFHCRLGQGRTLG